MGAKDTYFFNTRRVRERSIIQEWRTGTKCGGGSGTLIEKQCRRLFQGEVPAPVLGDANPGDTPEDRERIRVENRRKLQARLETILARAEEEAGESRDPSAFLARCGVVIQSDLIHKQNDGAARRDNLAGLFQTIAGNYKIDVLGNRQLPARGRAGRLSQRWRFVGQHDYPGCDVHRDRGAVLVTTLRRSVRSTYFRLHRWYCQHHPHRGGGRGLRGTVVEANRCAVPHEQSVQPPG